jgi:hypothetical protein
MKNKREPSSSVSSPTSERCAPGKQYESGSCFSLEQLVKISHAYNERLLQDSYKPKTTDAAKKIKIKYDKSYLLKELKKRFEFACGDNQVCWTKQPFVKALHDVDISKYTFRPEGPQGRFEWLSTTHIEDVMHQYEKIYSDFYFLGAVPMDFDDLPVLGISDLNFKELESKGIHRIGVVINTDEHWKPGQHWVASYVNLKKGELYFFDSTGRPPDDRVIAFLTRAAKHCLDKYKFNKLKDLDINHNTVVHQKGGSECGVYTLYFITSMLNGKSFDFILKNVMSDEKVNKLRKQFFHNVHFGGNRK